jgi:flavin reductase (DIM6/NTAB) family NADH-FMN oxidoreductase RutF
MVSVCIDIRCTVLPYFKSGNHFAVNVLSEHQRDYSIRFSECSDARFEGVSCEFGPSGAPLIHGCLAWFECRVERMMEAGDHIIVLGAVERVQAFEGRPLLYYNSQYSGLSR